MNEMKLLAHSCENEQILIVLSERYPKLKQFHHYIYSFLIKKYG